MTKTGWPPPPLMQDDNPQLSRWFATRPDARYVFKRNMQMKYVVRNHNGTFLGAFDDKDDAYWEAQEYTYQTGNPAYVQQEVI
jgi:hypothetical protein